MQGEPHASRRFRRSRFTWIAYGLLAFFAYIQSSWGPIMPFLRRDLDLSYTLGGAHTSAFAVGMLLATIVSHRYGRRWSGSALFWGSGAVMAAGALGLVLSPAATWTITSSLVMGVGGTSLLVMIQSTLGRHHGPHAPRAITEANVLASLSMGLVALFVSVGETLVTGGWRGALLVGAAVWLLLFLFGRNVAVPEPTREAATVGSGRAEASDNGAGKGGRAKQDLPATVIAWAVLVVGVAAEWSTAVWTPDFLVGKHGFSPERAGRWLVLFMVTGGAGRLVISRLADRFRPEKLLLSGFLLAVIGVGGFWLLEGTLLLAASLVLAGVGIISVYPLGVSVAVTTSGEEVERASSRSTLAAAVAILLAPQILGAAADSLGIADAFGLTLLLALAGVLLQLLFLRRERRHRPLG